MAADSRRSGDLVKCKHANAGRILNERSPRLGEWACNDCGAFFGGYTADITYISGPMSGLPEHNYPAFHAKAAELRAQGLTVINPAELPEPEGEQSWDWYLRRDLAELVKCTHVVLLTGWGQSRGACLEWFVARMLGMGITYPPIPRYFP